VGQTLGRYKLLERVGEGDCGVVDVAEQTEPGRRRMALKVEESSCAKDALLFYLHFTCTALQVLDYQWSG